MLKRAKITTIRRALSLVLTLKRMLWHPAILLPTQLVLQTEIRRRHPVVHFAGVTWDGRTGSLVGRK